MHLFAHCSSPIRALFAAALMASASLAIAQFGRPPEPPKHYAWSDTSLTPDQRADLVLKEMTLDEKISLLHGQRAFGPAGGNGAPNGSNGGAGFTAAIPLLGIPSIQMADSAYGVTRGAMMGRYSTALPNNLAAASAWDTKTAFEYGALIGRELRDQESGRNAVNANIDKRSMRETDLRAFEIALGLSDAGGVMCSYNRVNGTYACENGYLLNDVLKKAYNFKGFVLSDWGGTHSTAEASHAGLDMEQPGETFFGDALKKAVNDGDVSQAELDDHVHRIIRTIFADGVFAHPPARQVPDIEAGLELAQRIAEGSIVLLKNDHNVLPLASSARSIVLIGGHADKGVITGGGSAQVNSPGGNAVPPPPPAPGQMFFQREEWLKDSPLRALSEKFPAGKVTFAAGDDLAAASAAAKKADVAIVFAYQWESEGSDLKTLALSDDQNKLIEAVAAANPKTVVVLESGSPVTMPWADKVAGVVEAWYPGIRGAEALANILTGQVNPTGKLAVTFPKSDADLPHPTLVLPPPESQPHRPAPGQDISAFMAQMAKGLPAFQTTYDEKLEVGYKWYDAQKKDVLFPFGFGLSYTTYAYSALTAKDSGDALTVSFTVKNTGKRAGTEIAQVYTAFPDAAGEPPHRLIGWSRVELAPGESKPVTITVPHDRLTVYDEASDSWKLVPGGYNILAGASSRDLPLHQQVNLQ